MAANALKLKVPSPTGSQTADQLHTARQKGTLLLSVSADLPSVAVGPWQPIYDRDFLRVAKSQLFFPAIARNSSRMVCCSGVTPSLARITWIPSLIPKNAPRMAAPSFWGST